MTAKKRAAPQQYSDTVRLGTLAIALRDGIASAHKQTKVPERTIYNWFEAVGGLAEVRSFAVMAAERALSTAEEALCQEVTRRLGLGKMADDEVMLTFRALIELRLAATATANAGAASQANAVVNNITFTE